MYIIYTCEEKVYLPASQPACLHACIHACMQRHSQRNIRFTYIDLHTCARAYLHTDRASIHASMHTCIHTCIQTCARALAHTHTQTYLYRPTDRPTHPLPRTCGVRLDGSAKAVTSLEVVEQVLLTAEFS